MLIRSAIDDVGVGLIIEKLVITLRGKDVDDCALRRLYDNLVGSMPEGQNGELEQATGDELGQVILEFEAFVMCRW